MNRRQMIKVTGGSAIAAMLLTTGGCSTRLPASAVTAWSDAREETDPRRWALAHAILAPNSHNLQSWRVDLSEPGTIHLYMDLNRLLPETDPLSRQMVMSQGTFLELLTIAAREIGYRAEVTPFPQGAFEPSGPDSRPVATVVLHEDASAMPDPIYSAIFSRHTNRAAYSDQVAPARILQAISASAAHFGAQHGFVTSEQPLDLDAHRSIAKAAWETEMTTPQAMLETFAVLRVGPREIAEHRDGISVNTPMARIGTRLGFFDRTEAPVADSSLTQGQIRDFNTVIDSTPMFFWTATDDNSRLSQLNAGRAFVRMQLTATALGLSMHPIQQALQEYPEQADNYRDIHRLCGAEAKGQTVQMWARLGFGPTAQPAPRRGLSEHII